MDLELKRRESVPDLSPVSTPRYWILGTEACTKSYYHAKRQIFVNNKVLLSL